MKKKILVIIGFLLVLSLSFFFILRSRKKPIKEVKKREKPTVFSLEELNIEDRPNITLTARPDGKELILTVENIKNFRVVEYELTYLSEDIQRGVIGSVNVEDKDSFTRKLLLGTCSRGVCRYDKNVSGGTLTVTFRGEKTYRFIKDFALEKQGRKTRVIMK